MIRSLRSSLDTRDRLLQAAGRVFSESGFRSATVREIVMRAGANIAAVNYHFRDKEGLYLAVLEESLKTAYAKHPPDGGLPPDAPPEERFHAFVLAFLRRVLDRSLQACAGTIMAREMVEPTAVLERVIRRMIQPMYQRLMGILRELAPARASEGELRLAAKSVVGQILFYKHCAPVIRRLEGELPSSDAEIVRLASHITAFSLQGLRSLGGAPGRASR